MHHLLRCALLVTAGTVSFAQVSVHSVARVQHIVAFGAGRTVEVEIKTTAPVVPQSQMITGPDRIVIDFPGSLPAPELRNLTVNRGAVKAIRAGLFSVNPQVTRVVLDLAEPQTFQIFAVRNTVMLKIGPVKGSALKLTDAALTTQTNVSAAAPTSKPPIEIEFDDGLLKIHTERATLAQVLFEVQRETGAEIAIPAGAETEEIAVELGPAPAREVLAALLNGSRYNFIFVGNNRGRTLQKAILSVR